MSEVQLRDESQGVMYMLWSYLRVSSDIFIEATQKYHNDY